MSISKRLHYESTIRFAGFVTDRLVNETGMAPDELAEVIGGYFADLSEPKQHDSNQIPTPRQHDSNVALLEEVPLAGDPQPDRSAGLDDRLAWINRHRPKRKLPHPGDCRWEDVPASQGRFRRQCSLCRRLYGYGRVK
ncbi:MAG: hypothetical protein ACYTAO_17780 [Planctomycetota bacterium]